LRRLLLRSLLLRSTKDTETGAQTTVLPDEEEV
jgi:hypothetical protein